MISSRFVRFVFRVSLPALLFASVAAALPNRTWVSSSLSGSDGNPCSETAPCATFVGALLKTAAGGEINCVNSGDFSDGSTTLAITKAITIDCGGAFGSISGPASFDAIEILAGPNDVVTLRNLSITGAGASHNGILYGSAKAVHVENVRISGFLFHCSSGQTSAASLLTIDNATLSDCNCGIYAFTSGSTAVVNINNTRISNTADGVVADNGSRVTIRDSTIYFTSAGVFQTAFSSGSNLGSTGTVVNSTLGFCNAALQSASGRFILAFGNTFVNDVVVYVPNGGSIFTGADNNSSGSATGTANGGSVPKI